MSARGLALVTVLWVLTLLALIAASFSNSSRTEIKLAFNQLEGARAEAMADAGVHAAILGLLTNDPDRQWRVDGTVYGWEFDEGEIRVNVWDEGGKIDLNAAPDELIKALFEVLGLDSGDAAELVDKIVDFRDSNDLRQLNGAEDRDYDQAGLPYGAKDAPFETIEELRQVLGMTPALYEAAAPALTVRARQRSPHEPTASPVVRLAMSDAGAQSDGEDDDDNGTSDRESDLVATDIWEDQAGAEPLPLPGGGDGVGPSLVDEEDDRGRELSVRSRVNTYTVHAEARTKAGSVFVREAVVEIGTAGELPYEFWAWKQGRRLLFPLPESEDDEP